MNSVNRQQAKPTKSRNTEKTEFIFFRKKISGTDIFTFAFKVITDICSCRDPSHVAFNFCTFTFYQSYFVTWSQEGIIQCFHYMHVVDTQYIHSVT